jgi:acyl-CoA hydrolase
MQVKRQGQRALSLISFANPKFGDELTEEAQKIVLI